MSHMLRNLGNLKAFDLGIYVVNWQGIGKDWATKVSLCTRKLQINSFIRRVYRMVVFRKLPLIF